LAGRILFDFSMPLGSTMVAAPEMAPTMVGVKKMCAVQVPPPPAILPPQWSGVVKSPLITIGLMG
jgi:hypothetical protein